MKIRAVANNNVIDADDGAAEELIKAGIYVRAGAKEKLTSTLTPPVPAPVPPAEPAAKKSAAKKASSTAVSPMTTASMPQQPKKGKPI